MKNVRLINARIFTAALLGTIAASGWNTSASALRMTIIPEEQQTTETEPVERVLSLKLPLEQPTFHWRFMSEEDLLAGKLMLRIIRGDDATEIVVFEDGVMNEDWSSMSNASPPDTGEVYFGFISSNKVPTAPGDVLELELHVVKDLDGIGAIETGILPKGIYKTHGIYSGLIDTFERPKHFGTGVSEETFQQFKKQYEFKAFLENWETQWPLTITSEEGWLPPKQREGFKRTIEELNRQEEETSNPQP